MAKRLHHEDVAEFLAACDQAPSRELAMLYFNLIREEFDELWDAWVRKGNVGLSSSFKPEQVEGTIDALADLIWVAYGMMLALGVPPNEAWSPVAKANLSKIDGKTGKVLKREDGKVLKPEGWESPSHAHLVSAVLATLGIQQEEGVSDERVVECAGE